MDIPQFMCSPAEGHLGCFQFGTIMNKAAMKTCGQVFVRTMYAFISIEWPDHMVDVC